MARAIASELGDGRFLGWEFSHRMNNSAELCSAGRAGAPVPTHAAGATGMVPVVAG
jgi:hypothetical protein